MADVGLNDRCLLPSCSSTSSGSLKTFKIQAFKKLLERGDDETLDKLQTIFNSHGEQATVVLHKSCYCSYTSNEHVKKFVLKRKAESVSSDEPPILKKQTKGKNVRPVMDLESIFLRLLMIGQQREIQLEHPLRLRVVCSAFITYG